MATKQKSIEDYRNAVKLLKLKVIKLQKQNEELHDKFREQGLPVENTEGEQSQTDQFVTGTFARSCKRIGLTPEMLFRAADKEGHGSVQSEDFRLCLSKVRLGLTQAQLTLLVRVFDEDCTGEIRKEDYINSLQAYGINEEKIPGQARTYGQESLLKYAKLLLMAQMSPEDSYGQMKVEDVTPSQFAAFVHAVDSHGSMTDKEVVAVFNHIDVNKNGTLKRNYYEAELRKAMKAAATDLGFQSSNTFSKTQQLQPPRPTDFGNNNIRTQPEPFKGIKLTETIDSRPRITVSPGKPMGNESKLNQSTCQINETQLMLNEEDRKLIQNIVGKLKAQGVDAMEFIKLVIQSLEVPAAGVMLYDFFKHFNKKVPKADQLQFFQAIDLNKNGSIDYDELMLFFLEFKSPSDNYDLLFEILTRKLQAIGISIDSYLAMEQIYEDTMLDMEQFFPLAQMLFNTPSRKHSDGLFKSLDLDSSGVLGAGEIISAVRVIMDRYIPPTVMNLDHTLNKSMRMSLKNMGEYSQMIRKIKPTLSENDHFSRYKMEGAGKTLHKEETKWETIFNSDLACLRYLYEVIENLDKAGPGTKWDDPEFGPIATDQFGSKSMYFADNDIPEGCPDPKEVKWVRPEEHVALLVENGHEHLKDKHVDVFDGDGAASNDVCQSKYLGNCWFVSALSIISGYDKYLQGEFHISHEAVQDLDDKEVQGMLVGVYPPAFQFLRKYGIYVMRFFKNFGWKYVIIDDKLATKDNEYVYGKCRSPTETWVNLIEKAYAKLHQCYFALTSGDIAQGLADMTGKVPDKTKLLETQSKEDKDKLWGTLMDCKKQGTMLGCSAEGETELFMKINDEDTGIMTGHAYGIIDVFELPDPNSKNYHKSHRLLKVRNPWGYGEWKMKWSENPDYAEKLEKFLPQINAYYDHEIELAKKEQREEPERYITGVDDGTFLMCFKSWRTVFSNLFMCIDFPDEWSGMRAYDKFGLQSSGAPTKIEATQISYAQKNPQYIIDLKRKDNKETTFYIQMQQIDGRLFWGERYPYPNVMKPILLCIYSLGDNEKCLAKFDATKTKATSGKFNLRREIDSNEFKLPNGRYAIIPCTKDAGCPIDFTISVYFDCTKPEITLSKYGDPRFKFEPVAEEEEDVKGAQEELRTLLKKQALDMLNQNK